MEDVARPYTASFVVVREAGKVAFVLRSNTSWMNGYYGLPSGKVEKAEAFSAAAIREAEEEIGIQISEGDAHIAHIMHRYNPAENMTWIDAYFEVEEYTGEPCNAEPDVHGELAWFEVSNLPENVIPSVKQALIHIEAGTVYSEYGWDGNVPDEV